MKSKKMMLGVLMVILIAFSTWYFIRRTIEINLDGVKFFNIESKQSMLIRVDDPLVLVWDSSIKNEEKNLTNVTVTYDQEGYSAVDGISYKINSKKPDAILIMPPKGGWDNHVDYHVNFDASFEFADDKTLGKKVSKTFKVDSSTFKKISGKLSFPKDLVSPNNMPFIVSLTNRQDESISEIQSIVFEKGESSIEYELLVPESRFGYLLSYELNGSDYNRFDFFKEKAYVGNNGMVENIKQADEIYISQNLKKDIEILEIPKVYNEIQKMRAEIFEPKMSHYEKVLALYEYVNKNMYYDVSSYNPYKEIPRVKQNTGAQVSQVFIEKNAVCEGFSYAMDYVLTLEGIDSRIKIADMISSYTPLQHQWNAVKLDGNYYNIDFTARVEKSNIGRIKHNIKPAVFFNDEVFGDSREIVKGKEYECKSVDYSTYFLDYWEKHPELNRKTYKLKGNVALPDGEKAPVGGVLVKLGATIGVFDNSPSYDFGAGTMVLIPEGKNHTEFTFTVVKTKEPITLAASTIKYGASKSNERVFFSKNITFTPIGEEAFSVSKIQLEEATYVHGKVIMPNSSQKADEDILIRVIAEQFDGTQEFEMNNEIKSVGVCIEKGMSSDTFTLAVRKSEKPYLLSYEIVNREKAKGLKETGYLVDQGMDSNYNEALKIDSRNLADEYDLTLIK